MDKYLNNVNSGGSNHQRYKRCIYNIIKDMTVNTKLFHSKVFKTKENQKHAVVKIKEINQHTTKYTKYFINVDENIKKYGDLYKTFNDNLDKLTNKVNIMTTLKKIKEKHVQQAYECLITIDNYWNELDKIDSSINYSFIDTTFRKVQEELTEISLINGLMGSVEITNNINTSYTNNDEDGDVDEDVEDVDEDDDFSDFM